MLAIWSPRPNAQALEMIAPDIAVHGLPVINIVRKPIDSTLISALIPAISSPSFSQSIVPEVLIFVSRHAVEHFFAQSIGDYFANKKIIAIGKRTEKTLRAHGVPQILTAPAPYNTEALLADKTFQALPYQRFGIVCGEGGNTKLQDELTKIKELVVRIECYHRDKIYLPPQFMIEFVDEFAIGGIILSSGEIAEAVAYNISRAEQWQMFDSPVFALSERIAVRAQQLRFQRVITAQQANEYFLYQRIINWWEGT